MGFKKVQHINVFFKTVFFQDNLIKFLLIQSKKNFYYFFLITNMKSAMCKKSPTKIKKLEIKTIFDDIR